MARTPARPANGMVLQFAHEMRGRQARGRQTNSTNRPCYLVNSLEPGKNKGVKKGSPIEAVAHAYVVTRPFRADTGADNAVPEAALFRATPVRVANLVAAVVGIVAGLRGLHGFGGFLIGIVPEREPVAAAIDGISHFRAVYRVAKIVTGIDSGLDGLAL